MIRIALIAAWIAMVGVSTELGIETHDAADPVQCRGLILPGLQERAGDPIKVLGLWLAEYRQGKIDLANTLASQKSMAARSPKSISVREGLFERAPLDSSGRATYECELRRICDRVAEIDDGIAVVALLEVAAVGLDGKKRSAEQLSGLVRTIGETALAKLQSPPSQARLREVALELRGAVGLAAIRALGNLKSRADLPLFEAALGHEDAAVRTAAAVGLGRAESPRTCYLLADCAKRDRVPTVVVAALEALAVIARAKRVLAEDDGALRRATTTAIDVLGTLTWQVDLAAVAFLETVRSADSVPALIAVLDRHLQHEGEKKLDRAAGVVRSRAHELLLSLTGAVYSKGAVDRWREWWDRVHDDFQVVDNSAIEDSRRANETSTGSFFGIPVRGSRVLFIVDFSGSMAFRSNERVGDRGQVATRMAIARRELKGATSKMAADSRFGLVWFSSKVGEWKSKLVRSTTKNKKSFAKFIDRVEPGGATNLWGGLETGMDIKWVEVTEEGYESQVDEVFVLSDGAPSVGSIQDPIQILAAVRDANQTRGVRINTVFVTGPDDENRGRRGGRTPPFGMDAAELMRQLAEQNGGVFIQPGADVK